LSAENIVKALLPRSNPMNVSNRFPIKQKSPVKTGLLVAGSIEISNQLISDLLEFMEVAEELINADNIRNNEFTANTQPIYPI
jgi:hypothetical protein